LTDDRLTAAEVADRLGKSRRTVGRMLAAGDFPGAERTSQGWRIPAADLDAQTDPGGTADRRGEDRWEHPPGYRRRPVQTDPADAANDDLASSQTTSTADTVARITAELEEWRRRAEVAEAVAAERADALADARASLALAQRLAAVTIAENVAPIPQAVEQTARHHLDRPKLAPPPLEVIHRDRTPTPLPAADLDGC